MKSALVKDERNLDKFDQVGHVFKGLESLGEGDIAEIRRLAADPDRKIPH